MNEKIRELAKKADPEYGNEFFEMPDAIVGNIAIQKFAELIVRECMDLVKDCYAEPGRSLYQTVCASTIIEEHFGVEE